jgi:hypothetical protein
MKESLTIKSNEIVDSLKWNNNTGSILVDDIAKSSLDSYKLTILVCL